jgi:hypothetical protein
MAAQYVPGGNILVQNMSCAASDTLAASFSSLCHVTESHARSALLDMSSSEREVARLVEWTQE